jgi:hypothetical protein
MPSSELFRISLVCKLDFNHNLSIVQNETLDCHLFYPTLILQYIENPTSLEFHYSNSVCTKTDTPYPLRFGRTITGNK